MALHGMRHAGYEVACLLTTVAPEDGRVQIQGIRRELLQRQTATLGMPWREIPLRRGANNNEYETAWASALTSLRADGIDTIFFGDLSLADVRAYREALLARHGVRGLFPVWGRETAEFVQDFLALGFKAVVTSVQAARLDVSFAGRELDERLLADLPNGVDPCGEGGEFHTFVYDGPGFCEAVPFTRGATTLRDGHHVCDLLLA